MPCCRRRIPFHYLPSAQARKYQGIPHWQAACNPETPIRRTTGRMPESLLPSSFAHKKRRDARPQQQQHQCQNAAQQLLHECPRSPFNDGCTLSPMPYLINLGACFPRGKGGFLPLPSGGVCGMIKERTDMRAFTRLFRRKSIWKSQRPWP